MTAAKPVVSSVNAEGVIVASSTFSSAAAPSLALPPNRFELELEFVQSLASPAYLHYLATSGILHQTSFLDFLRYLRYWKQPQFAKYLSYPHCLYFLDLLVPPSSDLTPENDNHDHLVDCDGRADGDGKKTCKELKITKIHIADSGEAFRREMAQLPFRNFVHEQQFYSWQFRSARLYGKGEGMKVEEGHVGRDQDAGDAGGA